MTKHMSQKINRLYDLSAKQLMREYIRITGESYYTHNRKSLIRKIAWLYQIKDSPPLSQMALERVGELVKDSKLRVYPPRNFKCEIPKRKTKRNTSLTPGTVLMKKYHGINYEVVVLDRGFMWDNTIYKSISGVAKAITGSHWNGKLFFGLK